MVDAAQQEGRLFLLNGVRCKIAAGAEGFRPSDVFAGLPFHRCPPEDGPLRDNIRDEEELATISGFDSDCAAFNSFGILSGGVVVDAVEQSFVDFTASRLLVPGVCTVRDAVRPAAHGKVRSPRPSHIVNGELYVASSLAPLNSEDCSRTSPYPPHRVRQQQQQQHRHHAKSESRRKGLKPVRLERLVRKMEEPMGAVPPDIAFPLQYRGVYLTRCQRMPTELWSGVCSTTRAFTCFSGRSVFTRICSPRADRINTAKRPLSIMAVVRKCYDEAHPKEARIRTANTLTSADRRLSLPPEVRGWALHWWVFSRYMAYLDVEPDSAVLLPVDETEAHYLQRARAALLDVRTGAYRQPPAPQVECCWHKLVCREPAELRLRLVRFETFFRFASTERSQMMDRDALPRGTR